MKVISIVKWAVVVACIVAAGLCLRSCMLKTARWIANEKAFCAANGMEWQSGNDKHNGSCVDADGFAHPISNEIRYRSRP